MILVVVGPRHDDERGGRYEAFEVNVPKKILDVGWAVLVLLALSCYTANLAAFLTKSEVGSYWDSMEKARPCVEVHSHPQKRYKMLPGLDGGGWSM